MWYIYTMEYYSAVKKDENNVICRKMDGSGDHHVRQSYQDEHHVFSPMWNLGVGRDGHESKRGLLGMWKRKRGRGRAMAEAFFFCVNGNDVMKTFVHKAWRRR
jgi:hypothetical protein